MGKHFRRLIAFIVALSFCSVLQLSALDAPFSGCDDKAASETVEKDVESPQIGAEKEAPSPTIKKKHSALPWILGGLGLVSIVAIIAIFSSKKYSFDIQGDWDISCSLKDGKWSGKGKLIIYGSGNTGTCSVDIFVKENEIGMGTEYIGNGTYSIADNKISISWQNRDLPYNFFHSGDIKNSNSMNGTMSIRYGSTSVDFASGLWNATK